jgi:hypothetical protein
MLTDRRMASLPSVAAAAAAATAAATAANYAASLPPPPLIWVAPPLPARPTGTMVRLAALPPLRVPVLRPGRTSNPARPSNLEAEFGQATGQVRVARCTHCAGGSGVWTECVVVAGFFGGSCANCHYGSEGARCSFRMYNQLFTGYLRTGIDFADRRCCSPGRPSRRHLLLLNISSASPGRSRASYS